jgi:hypothetical protein
MKTFRDINGTTWDIVGTLGVYERVRSETGVDLLDLPTTQASLAQLGDPFTLGRVLYQLCSAQAEARGVSPEKFYDLFNADVLHEASTAILEEVIFFCRKEMRPALQMALDKAKEADRKMVEMVTAKMGDLELEMDQALESLQTSTGSATSLRASSASTQGSGRSAASSGRQTPRRRSGGATPARS